MADHGRGRKDMRGGQLGNDGYLRHGQRARQMAKNAVSATLTQSHFAGHGGAVTGQKRHVLVDARYDI